MVKDETILMQLSVTRKAFLLEYGCAFFLLLVLVLNYIYKVVIVNEFNYFLLALVGLSLASVEMLRLLHRCLITNSKVLLIDGWFKQSKKHVFISSITDVSLKQSYWQRLVNYGNVRIQSSSGEEPIELKNVDNPEKIVNLLEDLIDNSAGRSR